MYRGLNTLDVSTPLPWMKNDGVGSLKMGLKEA